LRPATKNDLGFTLMTIVIILVKHAVAYLLHEYAHSFAAWAAGYMPNPLALDYGGLTPGNLVLLSDVGDNVPYDAIRAGGHGLAAAGIALAGPYVGNALVYVLLYAFAGRLRSQGVVVASVTFWLMLMCVGNVWSYVPIRAITTHADIAIAAGGLHIGVLTLFPLLLVPSLIVIGHFFSEACPLLIPAIAPGATARTAVVVTLTSLWFFAFFGGAGMSGSYGPVSQIFSLVSELLLLPLAALSLWDRCCRA